MKDVSEKSFEMEHFVIRIIIVSLALTMLTASVSCRFVHLIEDYDQPMTEMVAVCRKGCLLKVRILLYPVVSHSINAYSLLMTVSNSTHNRVCRRRVLS